MDTRMVISMKNPNALIAMAQVAQNANNPYATFCEYIKYCIFSNPSDVMTIFEIREAVGKEFGLYLPHNVLIRCLSYIQSAGNITLSEHQIQRVGEFDTEAFDRGRAEYRAIETAIIEALSLFASQYGRDWSIEYSRELLIKTLDRKGLAYDIFIHEASAREGLLRSLTSESEISEMPPDDEDIETEEAGTEEVDNQPLFTDDYLVGKFIGETLEQDTIHRDYLIKICAGLMLCVGTYQLPSLDAKETIPQINGTSFFFDTKLLLRFLGCASEAAVQAAQELVMLIQNAGGRIYYYPQTLEEMERAFEKAATSLSNGNSPRDDEMRLYVRRIKYNLAVITAKKASLKAELEHANIYLIPHETCTDAERIRYGFEKNDLQQFMRKNLPWDPQVIDNDALAIWETHNRRQGNYREYCGTSDHLSVFVTTNSKLIGVALKFRESRPDITAIARWKQNRLPVITDIRLTCRLWSPADQSERLSLLYLTANTIAAKRPTPRYLKSVRELAIQLREQAPQYSELCLPAYFDDAVTDAIFTHTMGDDDKLDINSLASTLDELSEWRAKEQEQITNQVKEERDTISDQYNAQTKLIISGAVTQGKKVLRWQNIALWLLSKWTISVTIIFAAIAAGLSLLIGNWHPTWAIILPTLLRIIECCSTSNFVSRALAKWLFPKIDASIEKRILREIREAERPYKKIIIETIKQQLPLWIQCHNHLEE